MKQKDLALLVGVHRVYLNAILNGREHASRKLAQTIAKKTKSSPDIWVFGSSASRQEAAKLA